MPNHANLEIKLPSKCLFTFLGDALDRLAENYKARIVTTFDSITKIYPIYIIDYKGEDISLVQAPVGAAASAQILDWLISYGCRQIITTGSCGTLVDIAENTFLVPYKALRDEGASYHYLPPSRFVKINPLALAAIEKTLTEHSLKYEEVMTWTTDGFYRETREMVKYRVDEGCKVVEMECLALAAVAEFRDVLWGQILFTADSLSDVEKYDPRGFGGDSIEYALKLALDTLLNFN
ncbi:nucleoside phosphorylase [Anaerococcus cruorum]|uniref:Uridine phosphorylase n=1 Tax=Anaerococcus cruorum TaxID=3115617 RepID=A0ABW9MVS8_9FIRM